ncbi:LacI family transcriptional regulator [Luteimicrobium album]|uniref:LacI family transcriptional regulator n=1 Tax=Luteimicrobium album TaxID=1054550 RepID=A0ABQ6HZZ1_9MICO|nr:LacI family transcriptional regulator [Luteimicrobium album]
MPSAEQARFRPVTLADVARSAGVSQATASRVVNGSARSVSPALTQSVLAAAEELGYATNVQAQAVARGTTTTVALLVSDIATDYFSSMAAAVMANAERAGLDVTIAVGERRMEREIELVRALRAQRARAIVMAETGFQTPEGADRLAEELRAYERGGGKVVIVSRTQLPFDHLDLDNVGGARKLGGALARLGYRRFLVLAGDRRLVTMHDRIEGFRSGLAERGIDLPEEAVVACDFSWEGARRAVSELDDAVLERTEAIFALNDEMALGAIAGLRGRGMQVPRDVAVAGFDDIRSLRDVTPGLTTVRIPLAEVGALVVDVVTGRRDAPALVPATVVLRDSTPLLG